ncbi:MAG TPA: CinA family protein [Hyphomonadaceae bacterium]|nr:CinA family protein [Hyphomonadaceae bacterium]
MSGGDRNPHQYVYTPALEDRASDVLRTAKRRGVKIAAAESCTGGSLAALLTDVEGLSHVFERGFVVYNDRAKQECLGVDHTIIKDMGAVSREVAIEMARGAIAHADADIAIAITGNAGPAGPNDEEGLVYIAAISREGVCKLQEHHFGAIGRTGVRMHALKAALDALEDAMKAG